MLGDADTAGWLARRFDEMSSLRARVVGRVPLAPELPGSNGLPVLGDVAALRPLINEERVQRAIVVPRGAVSDDLLNTIRHLSLGVRVKRATAAV
jgi:hypothetical protein